MAKDAGTKTDKPSDQEGKGTPAKEELETKAVKRGDRHRVGISCAKSHGNALVELLGRFVAECDDQELTHIRVVSFAQ